MSSPSTSTQKRRATTSSTEQSFLRGADNTADLCTEFLNDLSRPESPDIDTSAIDHISENSRRQLEVAMGKYQEGTLTDRDKEAVNDIRSEAKRESGKAKGKEES